MGAEAAMNAVYYNKIQDIEDEAERATFVKAKRDEYDEDINILRLASELIVDGIVEPEDLRAELITRFAAYQSKDRTFSRRRHGVTPV
jgi:methylmalonyl-CoA decarboxylase subunit alpha